MYTPSVTCEADNACHQFACNSGTGLCDETTTMCSDNDSCTLDSCDNSTGCIYTPIACNDNNVCTSDICSNGTGCIFSPITCDDGDLCTSDSCNTVTGCQYTTLVCDDGNASTIDSCSGGVCVYTATTTETTLTSSTGTTTTGSTGATGSTAQSSTSSSSSSTITSTSSASSTTGSTLSSTSGATTTPDACDGVECSGPNGCVLGACVAGECVYTQKTCSTSDRCLTASCNPTTGLCETANKSGPALAATCFDNNLCTTDTCANDECVFTSSNSCPSSNFCSSFQCDPSSGNCSQTNRTCNDANACTTDECNPSTGCVYTPRVCDDSDVCTMDSCSASAGCVFTPRPSAFCDDGNPCTRDQCMQGVGCVYEPINGCSICASAPCSLAPNACQETRCVETTANCASSNDSSACTAALATAPFRYCYLGDTSSRCTDANACTDNFCDPVEGCSTRDVVCNDRNACTSDSCDSDQGCVYTAIPCVDGDVCTHDSCDSSRGCRFTPIVASRPRIPSFVDIGCRTSVLIAGNQPAVGRGFWSLVAGGGDELTIVDPLEPIVAVTGVASSFTLRYTISYFSCSSFSAIVQVKRYSEVSDAETQANVTIGCQSSLYLNATAVVNGQGQWRRVSGSGRVNPNDRNQADASVTSIRSLESVFEWFVSAPSCVTKRSETKVFASRPQSVECVGCQVVSLGVDEEGNATFVNTCDPPVPLVVTDMSRTVTFELNVRMRSLSVGSGSIVALSAGMELDGDLQLTGGARMSLTGRASSLTVQRLDAGANSTISVGEGATVRIRGNLTSAGATFSVTLGNLTIEGSVTFDNGTSLELGNGGGMVVQGNMGFQGLLRYIFAVLLNNKNQRLVEGAQEVASVPVGTESFDSGAVINYGSSSGAFDEVSVVFPTASCEQVKSIAPSYGGSSMSIVVLVSPDPQCDSETGEVAAGGIAIGVIIGIAVAAVVVAVAATVVLVIVARHVRLKRSEAMFRARAAGRTKTDARLSVMASQSTSTIPT